MSVDAEPEVTNTNQINARPGFMMAYGTDDGMYFQVTTVSDDGTSMRYPAVMHTPREVESLINLCQAWLADPRVRLA